MQLQVLRLFLRLPIVRVPPNGVAGAPLGIGEWIGRTRSREACVWLLYMEAILGFEVQLYGCGAEQLPNRGGSNPLSVALQLKQAGWARVPPVYADGCSPDLVMSLVAFLRAVRLL